MKEYVVVGIKTPFAKGSNNVENLNVRFYDRRQLEDFLHDLADDAEDCPPADVVMSSIDKYVGYRFSADGMEFLIKINK